MGVPPGEEHLRGWERLVLRGHLREVSVRESVSIRLFGQDIPFDGGRPIWNHREDEPWRNLIERKGENFLGEEETRSHVQGNPISKRREGRDPGSRVQGD